MRGGGAARRAAVLCATLATLTSAPAAARDLWTSDDYERSVTLESALKAYLLAAYATDDPVLFPQRTIASDLWRLRFTLSADATSWMSLQIAYDLQALTSTTASGGLPLGGFLPATAPTPYRIRQLAGAIVDANGFTLRENLDRAWVAFHPEHFEITVGRQAIGYGRGLLFGAVDIFAPFTALQVDRQWRRGVDAVHVEARISERFSADVVGAFGTSLRYDSAFVGRLRGYLGDADGEILFGHRATDWLLGATFSSTVGEGAIYGEAAWFRTNGQGVAGSWLGTDDWTAKFLAGGSYTFGAEAEFTLAGEYHYSGFGFPDVSKATTLLMQPAYQTRFLRGDSQILGRHVFAAVFTWNPLPEVSTTLSAMVSPVDGSGVVGPSATWTVSDHLTLIANAYVPWGARPQGGTLRSDWGLVPYTAFFQIRFYD